MKRAIHLYIRPTIFYFFPVSIFPCLSLRSVNHNQQYISKHSFTWLVVSAKSKNISILMRFLFCLFFLWNSKIPIFFICSSLPLQGAKFTSAVNHRCDIMYRRPCHLFHFLTLCRFTIIRVISAPAILLSMKISNTNEMNMEIHIELFYETAAFVDWRNVFHDH